MLWENKGSIKCRVPHPGYRILSMAVLAAQLSCNALVTVALYMARYLQRGVLGFLQSLFRVGRHAEVALQKATHRVALIRQRLCGLMQMTAVESDNYHCM